MVDVNSKYRGSILYHLVYCELIRAAQYGGLTTYQAIAQIMGLPLTGNHMGNEVGIILGEIVRDELSQGRPMLSAVAVGVDGVPGSGFAGLARELGKLNSENKADVMAFWKAERAAVYKTWAKKFKA